MAILLTKVPIVAGSGPDEIPNPLFAFHSHNPYQLVFTSDTSLVPSRQLVHLRGLRACYLRRP